MSYRAIALLLLISVGCSPTLFTPVEEDSEAEEMKSRILELQRQARMSEVELERLRRQVAELEARLESGEGGAPAEPPELQPVLDDEIGGEEPEASEVIESSDIAPPEEPSASPPARPREEAPDAGEAPLPPVTVAPGPLSAAAQEMYDRGYTFYHRGLYVDAESAFQQFLGAHPSTELSDNAHYWIGESRFARADYEGALAAFRETLERYPEGNKVPDALLKAADCFARLGDVDAAREAYDEVIRRFPASAAAVSAEERRGQYR